MSATKIGADVPKVASSNYDVVRNGALKAASWLGRQVQYISGTAKDMILKVVAWAKPFFSCAAKFFSETFDKSKELLVANKEFAIPAAVFATVVAFGVLFINNVICNNENQATPAAV